MDNSNDKTNKPEDSEIEVATPNEIEIVEETEVTIEPAPESTEAAEESEDNSPSEENDEDIESTPEETASPSHSLSRLELESLIQKYLDESEKLKNQLKSQREMYNAAFENDAEYSQANEDAKDLKKKVAAAKQRITQQPSVQSANEEMQEIKSEIKDLQEAISGLAEQYQTVAGTNQIVQDDGKVLEIIRNFKVIRKKG